MLAKPVFGQFSVNQITNMIAADDLNNLLDYYNEIWNDPSTGPFTYVTHNDTSGDNLERRFGWGQGPATFLDSANNVRTLSQTHITTGIGTEITITDINQTIAQLNAGLYHTEDDPTLAGLIPQTIDTGQRIPKSLYETVANKIESFIAEPTNKYKVDWSTFSLYELQTTNSADWQLDLEVIHKFTFNSYNEARYFFNSGGEFTLELEMQPGGSAGNHVWQQIFDQFDSIRIGAETCRVVSDAVFDVISTSGVNKGFYTGIESSGAYSTILDAGVFRYNTNSGSEYSASSAYVYVYSEYNSRRIRIQLAADEVTPGGTFNIYVKVILVEDADDNFLITQDITLSSGYVQPSTTPLTTDGNKSFMTVGSKLFDFKERVAPTITLEGAGWTEGEYGTGEELTNWSGTWLKDVKAGYFITGQEYTIKSINDNIPVTLLITGHEYKIITVGTTDFTKLGAANNTIGTTFTATDIGTGTGTAGGATSTDTDFTLIGSADSNINTVFTATGPGTGSGSTDEVQDTTDDPGNVWELNTSDDTYTTANVTVSAIDYTWNITAPASVIGGSSGIDDDIVITSSNSTPTATFELLVKYTLDSNTIVQLYKATRTLSSNSNTYDLAIPHFRDYAGSKITQATIEVWDDPTIDDADLTNPRATATVNVVDAVQTISLGVVPSDQVNEGSTLTIDVSTENIPTGTVLNYVFTPPGELTTPDTGSETVTVTSGGSGNIPNIIVVPDADATTEGDETLTITVSSADDSSVTATTSVIVDDTSRAYETWTLDAYLNQVYGPNGANVTGYNSSTHITALENLRAGIMGTATPSDLGKTPTDVWREFLRATFADPNWQIGLSTSDQTYIDTLNGYIIAYNSYSTSVSLVEAFDYLVRRPTTGTTYDDIGYKWAIANPATVLTANQIIYNVLDDNPNDIT